MKEIWDRLIYQNNDYGDFYLVSNLGRIKGVKTNTIRKLNQGKTGYLTFTGSLGSDKNKKLFRVHRAVCETFIPNINKLPYINHRDGNKLNNYATNLEWCTPSENMFHAYQTGLKKQYRGHEHYNSKLNKDQVDFIRKNYRARDKEFGARVLAKKFNVDHSIISNIVNKKSYI